MSILRQLTLIGLCLLASACVNQTIKSTSVPTVASPSASVPEEQLLDVAVVVFDPGLDDYEEDEQVYPEVRKAEAVYPAEMGDERVRIRLTPPGPLVID